MALYGKGMLMTFTETLSEDEVDFNEWYNREHIDERVWMPGFHRARRYIDADGTAAFKYLATYETSVVQDLADPEYMELLKDQSDWSKKVMAKFTKFERITADITIDFSHGFGGGCSIAWFNPKPEVMDDLRDYFRNEFLKEIVQKPEVVGAVLAENNLEVANKGRQAQGIEIPDNETPSWIIIVEAQDSVTASRSLSNLPENGLPKFSLVGSEIVSSNYNLIFGNNR